MLPMIQFKVLKFFTISRAYTILRFDMLDIYLLGTTSSSGGTVTECCLAGGIVATTTSSSSHLTLVGFTVDSFLSTVDADNEWSPMGKLRYQFPIRPALSL